VTRKKTASNEDQVINKFTSAIKLIGGEVKSIRAGKVSINEAYCYIKDNEIFIKNMHISDYQKSSKFDSHEPTRIRKLLLRKVEIIKLGEDVEKKGLTIVPTSVIINDGGLVKIEIALSRGKNIHDKRISIKEKDYKLQISRELNNK
jgi:SsrA-binding protein